MSRQVYEDEFSRETKEILDKINSLDNLEKIDYDFEWNLPNGLRYVSADFIDLCITMLEKGNFSLNKIIKNETEKIEISNIIHNLCNNRDEEENYNDKIVKEKIQNGELIDGKGKFTSGFLEYENNPCIKCRFSKCPKFYTGYILYLKNKGLLENVLKDREEYRRNEFKSDYFTFEWKPKDGLKNVPEKTFNYAMALFKNRMVFVEQNHTTEKNGPIITIRLALGCNVLKANIDDINSILKFKDTPTRKWIYVTRNTKKLLYKCNPWPCTIPYCMFDVAGYLFYLDKCGKWDQVEKDRKYYEEHKEEIERLSIEEQEKQFAIRKDNLKQKSAEEIENILKYKSKIANVEEIIDKVLTEKGLHISIEGKRGTGKFDLANKICKLLNASEKIDNDEPEYLSLHNLAFKNTYAQLEHKDTTIWTVQELSLKAKHLYVLTDVKEFIDEYKKVTNSSNYYMDLKRMHRTIELITSLFNEDYIIIVSDKDSVDELLKLDSKIKFVYQNNRYEISNLQIDELFKLYCKNLNDELLAKLRNDEKLTIKVKDLFFEYVGINAEFFPFYNEELAKYLANYCVSKKDFIFPDNIYKRESVEESLKNIIGLESVKDNIKKFEKYALYTVKAKNLGIKMNKSNLHMIFTGNPGTGKTTIARIMAKMLYDLGLISENKLVEVERKDLVAGYIGQTAPKTAEVISKAMGGVLFIDEAYTLAQNEKDFGGEAIATLIKAMEDYKDNFVVIFAGYRDEMKTFLDINPGISSRIGYTFDFEDYSKEELNQMFHLKMRNMGYSIDKKVEHKILKIFDYYSKRKYFGNGRFIDKLIQEVIMKHALSDSKNINQIIVQDIPTIEELNNENYSTDDADEMLDKLVGLHDLKEKIKEFGNYMKFLKKAEEANLVIPNQNLHMIFTGNPGTGKTTVARIIAKILFDMGIIHENKLVEVERKDLIAGYVGQTAPKTNEVIEKAMGGVLFIDEAYSLALSSSSHDFGGEAIATLIKAMEDHKGEFVVIFAGYREEMGEFLNMNPGIASRVGYTFHFSDYAAEEYCEIYYRKIAALGLTIEEDAKENVEKVMKYFCNVENNGNGRFVDKVVQNTLLRLANKKGDITVLSKECIPTIQDMTKNMFAGERMINPDYIDEASQRKTAIHEIGHATIRYLLENTPGIKKITINAEGTGTLGYVEFNSNNRKYTMSKKEYTNRICGLLGGMCNEIVFLGCHESGNASDLEKASKIVRNMITKFGMSSFGLYTFPYEQNSEKYIYKKANKMLSECYDKTIKLLEENKEKTEKAVKYLLKHKEIDEEQFIKIMAD